MVWSISHRYRRTLRLKFHLYFSALENKLTPLNYDNRFAYGCLHAIPIPNTTLDKMFTPEQEKTVLVEIFNQTDGYNWKTKTHWGNHSVSHCLWYGITCDRTNRYVINIYLGDNNLIGTLPGSLWKLRNLQGLCVDYNFGLQGSVSDILSANMTNLLLLSLSFNKLSGRIPGEILVKMRSLVKIKLCCQKGKGLSGEIPKDIGNLTELQVLSLGENRLHGSIPKSIKKLKKLWFLDLETAEHLEGGFDNLFSLTSLQYMHLSLAGLNGTLPNEFGLYFPAMVECLLPGNHFTGNIPSTIGNMTNLQHLNLASNDFSGQIPRSIGSMPVLQIADFSENHLTSLEKGILFTSQSMEVLSLASNKQLNVSFEFLLEALEPINGSLHILNASECHFYGTISNKLWDFHSLISVDLSGNRLFGELPSPTENMLFLVDLDVSNNNLSGQIPHISLLSLKFLDLSNNTYMQESDEWRALPKYMTIDFTTLTRRNPSDKFKCPNARFSYNNGLVILDPSYYRYRLCICDIGYYGSGKTCLPCMEGATCKDQMPPAQHMVINVGYWPSSSVHNVTHLVKCSQVLGTSLQVNTSCNPTGTCDCGIEWSKEGNDTKARLSTVCKKTCLCLKGSKDRFCSRCENGYYKQGILCYACPKTKTSVYILAVLAVLTMVLLILALSVFYQKKRFLSVVFVFVQIILLAVLTMLGVIPSWLLELNAIALFIALAGKSTGASGMLKISVFYFQTLDALISNTDVWPSEVLETQRYISSVFNIRFSGLKCVIPKLFTPLGELLSLILLPIICIVGIWLYYALGYAILRFRNSLNKRFRLRNSCLQLSIVALNFSYFPIVKKTAAVLARCEEDNNYRYLLEAPWLECDGCVYTMLQAFGWLALVLCVIGVPFGVFLPLLRINVAKRDKLTPQERETLDSWLGSIYLPYKKQCRSYFEILFLLRRMLIAFSLSFIPRASSFQTIAVCFVLLVSLCFQLLVRPFHDSYEHIALENTAETLVLLTLHFSFMNIRYAILNPDSSVPIVWMVIVLNVVLLCSLALSTIFHLGRARLVQIFQNLSRRGQYEEPLSDPSSPLIVDERNS